MHSDHSVFSYQMSTDEMFFP